MSRVVCFFRFYKSRLAFNQMLMRLILLMFWGRGVALIFVFCLPFFASPVLAGAGEILNSTLTPSRSESSNVWFDIRQLNVEGRGWNDTKAFYDRLPAKAEGLVRQPVWELSRNSAGMCVRFVTEATTFRARWALTESWLYLPNMTAIGKSGLDLYVKTEKGWHWLAVGQPTAQTNDVTLVENLVPGKTRVSALPATLQRHEFVELGIPTNAIIEKAGPWGPGVRKPMVFYGTSILQGLSASRPGMVHNAILGRRFNWPTINLGFSGNGKMEPEMADLLAELDRPFMSSIVCPTWWLTKSRSASNRSSANSVRRIRTRHRARGRPHHAGFVPDCRTHGILSSQRPC